MQLFGASIQDANVRVKTATLKALTTFLTSIGDEDTALKYQGMMSQLLDVVIEVLKTDEEQGQESLQSLTELTESYGDMWATSLEKLIYVVSEIMRNTTFEHPTRQAALEIVGTLTEAESQLVRTKAADKLQADFFPALCIMLTEVEDQDNLEEWAAKEEEDVLASNDPSSVAAETLARMAQDLGEKTTLACSTALIREAIANAGSW